MSETRKTHARHGFHWLQSEVDKLGEMSKSGGDKNAMSKTLQRTVGSVVYKCRKCEIVLPKKTKPVQTES
jgi:hypothetical protein